MGGCPTISFQRRKIGAGRDSPAETEIRMLDKSGVSVSIARHCAAYNVGTP